MALTDAQVAAHVEQLRAQRAAEREREEAQLRATIRAVLAEELPRAIGAHLRTLFAIMQSNQGKPSDTKG